MEALVQQFFNFAVMARALPLVLTGLEQTIVLCLIVMEERPLAGPATPPAEMAE